MWHSCVGEPNTAVMPHAETAAWDVVESRPPTGTWNIRWVSKLDADATVSPPVPPDAMVEADLSQGTVSHER